MSNPLKQVMPEMLEHEGVWEGNYQHLDIDGNVIDEHASRVECVFPEQGDVVYIQKNTFTWSDGRIARNEFGGILEGDRLFWDTDTFRGYGWVASPNMLLLDLDRKDDIGSSFYEVIIMGANKQNRARTWHWFKDGQCYRRTLCNERLSQSNSLLA